MKAFVNTPITKEKFLKHLRWHQEQDAFIKGRYGGLDENNNFKGCAVGCSLRSIQIELGLEEVSYSDHASYEKYSGVPEWLARVEERIFEMLPDDRSKKWPVEFVEEPRFKQQKEAVVKVTKLWQREDLYSAREEMSIQFADKLLELMSECK